MLCLASQAALALVMSPAAFFSPTSTRAIAHMSTSAVERDDLMAADADAVFAVIDRDGSGEISRDELLEHLVQCGYSAEAVDKVFMKLDADRSGCLSREELRSGFRQFTPLRQAPGFGNYNEQFKEQIHVDADALFNAIDADNDGEITDFELRIHLRQFGNFTDVAITNIFELLDADANGGIDRDELRSAFVRYSALRLAIGQGPTFK